MSAIRASVSDARLVGVSSMVGRVMTSSVEGPPRSETSKARADLIDLRLDKDIARRARKEVCTGEVSAAAFRKEK